MQVLQRRWDPTFSEYSYGFRPGRSSHQAVPRAQGYIAAGHHWVMAQATAGSVRGSWRSRSDFPMPTSRHSVFRSTRPGKGLIRGGKPVRRSITSLPREDSGKCTQQDGKVGKQTPLTHILCVHFDPSAIFAVVAAADLPDAGYARPSLQIQTKLVTISPHFHRHDRARSYQAHVASDDVYELRQFIKNSIAAETGQLG